MSSCACWVVLQYNQNLIRNNGASNYLGQCFLQLYWLVAFNWGWRGAIEAHSGGPARYKLIPVEHNERQISTTRAKDDIQNEFCHTRLHGVLHW